MDEIRHQVDVWNTARTDEERRPAPRDLDLLRRGAFLGFLALLILVLVLAGARNQILGQGPTLKYSLWALANCVLGLVWMVAYPGSWRLNATLQFLSVYVYLALLILFWGTGSVPPPAVYFSTLSFGGALVLGSFPGALMGLGMLALLAMIGLGGSWADPFNRHLLINIGLLSLILHGTAELYLHKARALNQAFSEVAVGRARANAARAKVVRAVLHELAGPLTVLEFCVAELRGDTSDAELAERIEGMLERMRSSVSALEHSMREELG